jgi:dethiobiotin synthetase
MTESGLFVVGTDTGVGKTVVAAALIHYLRDRGVNVGAFKPVESGGTGDSAFLREAAGGGDPPELVSPYSFSRPISPHQAAEEEGREISISAILEAFESLKKRHDFIVAEGAGGLLVPLRRDFLLGDLVARLGLPVLVVARAAVGTINHTLLTVRQAQSLGLRVLGVVINYEKPMSDCETVSKPEEMAHFMDVPLLGRFPHLDSLDRETLKKAVADSLDLSSLKLPGREGIQGNGK